MFKKIYMAVSAPAVVIGLMVQPEAEGNQHADAEDHTEAVSEAEIQKYMDDFRSALRKEKTNMHGHHISYYGRFSVLCKLHI